MIAFNILVHAIHFFTPRPLAPLYDLALQINKDWVDKIQSVSSRTELFTKFVQELTHKHRPVVVVFEDIHWADEATLDFIKTLCPANKPHQMFVHSYLSRRRNLLNHFR
jgi:hypothetical protein